MNVQGAQPEGGSGGLLKALFEDYFCPVHACDISQIETNEELTCETLCEHSGHLSFFESVCVFFLAFYKDKCCLVHTNLTYPAEQLRNQTNEKLPREAPCEQPWGLGLKGRGGRFLFKNFTSMFFARTILLLLPGPSECGETAMRGPF